ncbi:GIY-YIG nuclease family protein [uncultured Gimesia sp.]|uniref:GIY-YIG nuclease family protein n=1 Tax=uncultured Gimesia sp. TaxID=1678688 RepID=UPI0030DCEBC7|tara:strand:+ start:15208 stop:16029 length:822 start_codon:yes stop_codon:yes gene_type:complete
MFLRLSHKLNQKIKTGKLNALPLHQNPLADWSCRLFYANRSQYILLSNSKSLYSCVMPGKGVTNEKKFATAAFECIRDFTADDAQQWAFRKYIAPEKNRVQVGKALNRSVTSCMNQLVEYAQDLLIDDQLSPHEAGFKINDYLLSSIGIKESDWYGTPNDAFKNLVSQMNESVDSIGEEPVPDEKKTEKQPATWFVYILQCADGSLYTGITTDLTRRCEQHNAGTGSRYTRSRLPVSIVYHEIQATRSLALKRELAIKALSRKEKETLIKSMH